ncbi:hypothetical protein ACFWBR_42280 [Streptomyces sp. NPDC060006]|uniref:phage tail assembly protein T n=1 Tax=unclassified Streptomyces TaxID=2593676 RepID=UPI0036B63FC9
MERFTSEEMIRLVAYQNLYGPITPERLDLVIARLGQDVVSPFQPRGRRTKLRDHLIVWSRNAKPRRSGRDLLAAVKGIQAKFDEQDKTQSRRGRRRRGTPQP